MFILSRIAHLLRSGPRRARSIASIRARAALAAAQPPARRLRWLARSALVAGVVVVVLSLVPGWLGYQPREDVTGGLALVSVAGAAGASSVEGATALVVPVPHLASVVEATASMPGRLTLLTLPLLGLLAASLVQRAGHQWPADRLPSLPRTVSAVHAVSFPRGPAPVRPAETEGSVSRPATSRSSVVLLTFLAAAVALLSAFGRRPYRRG